MRISILTLSISLLLIACDNEKKQQEEKQNKLFTEVMAVHDEVMPQMSVMMKLIKKLNAQSDSLLLIDNVDSVKVNLLKEATVNLKEANESMMSWMHQFSKPKKDTPHEEAMEFLEAQKISITKVKEAMISAKSEAEQIRTN